MPIDVVTRNNVKISGSGEQTIILAHGFGCNQSVWRFMVPLLEEKYRVIQFDYVGCGNSDFSAYKEARYSGLEGYALDIIEICDALSLTQSIFVGHSVSCTIGWIVAQQRPELFSNMVAICPSPCFLNIDAQYQGGFEKSTLEKLIDLMRKDFIGWGNYLAPLIAKESILHPESQSKSEGTVLNTLLTTFCSNDVIYSKPFASATFLSDYRHLLPQVTTPNLVLQSANDVLVATSIGQYTQQNLPNAMLEIIEASGHCLHLSHPMHVVTCLNAFVEEHTAVLTISQ